MPWIYHPGYPFLQQRFILQIRSSPSYLPAVANAMMVAAHSCRAAVVTTSSMQLGRLARGSGLPKPVFERPSGWPAPAPNQTPLQLDQIVNFSEGGGLGLLVTQLSKRQMRGKTVEISVLSGCGTAGTSTAGTAVPGNFIEISKVLL